jgi:hypothetical protein
MEELRPIEIEEEEKEKKQDSSEFNCSICLCLLYDPISLGTCQHTFCKHCIRRVNPLLCPECRKTFTPSHIGAVNPIIKKLLKDIFGHYYEARGKEVEKIIQEEEEEEEEMENQLSEMEEENQFLDIFGRNRQIGFNPPRQNVTTRSRRYPNPVRHPIHARSRHPMIAVRAPIDYSNNYNFMDLFHARSHEQFIAAKKHFILRLSRFLFFMLFLVNTFLFGFHEYDSWSCYFKGKEFTMVDSLIGINAILFAIIGAERWIHFYSLENPQIGNSQIDDNEQWLY